MYDPAYVKIAEYESQPEAVERSIQYLEAHMRKFLRRKERVLICFSEEEKICHVFEQAVLRCDAIPLLLGEDRRWKTILKTAFSYKCNAVIGPPLFVLGLAKLARYMGAPLYTRNVILAGYPCTEWMVKGIQQVLDCQVWGCFDPGAGSLVAGFSCGKNWDIHFRDEEFGIEIVDDKDLPVPEGAVGRVIIYPKAEPSIRYDTMDLGRLKKEVCTCGSCAPRLTSIDMAKEDKTELSRLGEELHRWTSILDCRLSECGYGKELEMVVFPGEKLPALPSFSKMVIRPWDPEKDEPFPHSLMIRNRLFSEENH